MASDTPGDVIRADNRTLTMVYKKCLLSKEFTTSARGQLFYNGRIRRGRQENGREGKLGIVCEI